MYSPNSVLALVKVNSSCLFLSEVECRRGKSCSCTRILETKGASNYEYLEITNTPEYSNIQQIILGQCTLQVVITWFLLRSSWGTCRPSCWSWSAGLRPRDLAPPAARTSCTSARSRGCWRGRSRWRPQPRWRNRCASCGRRTWRDMRDEQKWGLSFFFWQFNHPTEHFKTLKPLEVFFY